MSKKLEIEEIEVALKSLKENLYTIIGKSARGGQKMMIVANDNWHFMIGDDKFNVHLEGGPVRYALHFEVSPYTPHSKLSGELLSKNDRERNRLRKIFENKIELDGVVENKARGNAVLSLLNYEIDEEYNLDKFCAIMMELIDEIDKVLKSEGYELKTGEI